MGAGRARGGGGLEGIQLSEFLISKDEVLWLRNEEGEGAADPEVYAVAPNWNL